MNERVENLVCAACGAPLTGSPYEDFGGSLIHSACLREGMNEMYGTDKKEKD